MLEFDNKGFLIPNDVIPSSLQELEQFFVLEMPTGQRKHHFDSYLNYSKELKKLCKDIELTQWIDGSFVTKKENPNDIDLVTFLDFESTKSIHHLLESFGKGSSKTIYEVDAYIVYTYSIDDKRYFLYQSDSTLDT
ncbi:hypothetical protein WAF17_08795 [Bernardetia sp. ABR2-2B]|uniref:DUF6932 family protein n=1 Tax=Bernardetia sp. ABR2-2B TaxID=3127472 RepID=UPI0030D0DA54